MIRQIPVKLPRSFEKALGYPGDSRQVAFYWDPCGDETMYDDGICSGDCNWPGFLEFVRHPSVAPWLSPYDLGSSDSEAKHWLLCDRESRKVYVGERDLVQAQLSDEARKRLFPPAKLQISPEELKEMQTKIFNGFLEAMERVPAPTMAEVQEKMRRDQEAVENMVKELGQMGNTVKIKIESSIGDDEIELPLDLWQSLRTWLTKRASRPSSCFRWPLIPS